MYNSVRKLFGLFLLLLLVSESLQSQTKVINVNIFGGVSPYNNPQWNNWNVGTKTAPLGFTNLKYSTGELTGFNISWNVVHEAVVDNSATYGGGVFPAEALRNAMYTTSSTFNITGTPGFTISGLDNNKIYDFEFVGSRNNAGQTSYYQARGITTKESSNLSTYLNKDNSVFIQNISPVNGTITLRWARPNLGTFAYLNMFRIYEKPDCRTYSTQNFSLKPNQFPFSFRNKIYGQPGVFKDTLLNAVGCDSIISLNLFLLPEISYQASYTFQQGISIDTIKNSSTGSSVVGNYGRISVIPDSLYFRFQKDKAGNYYYIDENNGQLMKVSTTGITNQFGDTTFGYLFDLVIDKNDNIFVSDYYGQMIFRLTTDGKHELYAGGANWQSPMEGYRTNVHFNLPTGLMIGFDDDLYVASHGDYSIRRINKHGEVKTIRIFNNNLPPGENVYRPEKLALDRQMNIYFTSATSVLLRRLTINGLIETVGGCTGFINTDFDTCGVWGRYFKMDTSGRIFAHDSKTKLVELGYRIIPSLPDGLRIDSLGRIFGTAVNPSPETNYLVIAQNYYGADTSVIKLTINSNCTPGIQGVKRISIKPTDFPYFYNGKTYNVPGDYRDTLLTAAGCDSIHILKLQLLPDIIYNSSYTVYAGQSVTDIVPQSLGSNVNGLKGRITKVADSTVFWYPRDSFGNYYYISGGSIFRNTPAGATSLFCNVIAPYSEDLNDIAIDDSNYVYVTSTYAGCVLRISPTGNQEVYAGGVGNLVPKEGYRTQIALDYASGLHFGDNGELYVCAYEGRSISVIDRNGWVKVVCDYTGLYPFGSPVRPNRLDLDGSGNVYFNDAAYYYLLELGITNNLNWYTGCKDLFEGENDSCAVNGNELKVDTAGFIYVKTPNATKRVEMGFSISPQLPNGLKIDSLGRIVGTPNATSPLTTYQIIAQNYYGSDTTTFQLEVAANCTAIFDPLPDTLSSCLDSISLDAGAGYQYRLWSNGDTSRISIIRQSGPVAISVTTNLGCTYRDTVMVEIFNPRIAQQDTTVLAGTSIQLNMLLPKTGSMKDAEGRIYKTTTIGSRTWMAENLSVSRYQNGDIIPYKPDPVDWANTTTGAWCWYNNDSATYASIYGKLYNGYAIIDPRGLAPLGWHLSSNPEWDLAAEELGGGNIAGGKMKSLIDWNAPNTGATNSSGFNAKPAGARDGQNGFMNALNYGYWWTSTAPFVFRSLSTYNTQIFGDNSGPKVGKSVRLVSDMLVGEGIRYLWSTGDTTASITVSPTVTTKYKVIITNGRITCTDSVEIQVASLANAGIITGDSSKCMINDLVLNSSGTQGTIQWQLSGDSISFSNIGAANNSTLTFQTSLLTQFNKYYYFRIVSVMGDSKDTSEVHKVYIERLLNPISVHASEYQPVCPGAGGLTMYNYEGGSIQWYSKTNIDSAFRLEPGVTTTTYLAGPAVTTYYQAVVTPRVCPSVSTTAGIEVAVRPQPPTAADVTRCGPGTVELIAANTAYSVIWADTLGNILQAREAADGQSITHFTTPVLSQTTTYRVMNRSTDAFGRACQMGDNTISDFVTVRAIINQSPSVGAISGDTLVCSGSTFRIQAANVIGQVQWQESWDNLNFVDIPNATNATLTHRFDAGSTRTLYYKAKIQVPLCPTIYSSVHAVRIEVNDNMWDVTPINEFQDAICPGSNGGGVIHGLFSGSNISKLNWYRSSDGINYGSSVIGVGTLFIEPIYSTTWYKVMLDQEVCPDVINYTHNVVIPIPAAPIVTNGSNCGPGRVTLHAIPPAGAHIVWYDQNNIIVGEYTNTFVTPVLNTNTLYYAQSKSSNVYGVECTPSAKVMVEAFINPIVDTTLFVLDPPNLCGTGASVRMQIQPYYVGRWFKDGVAIPGIGMVSEYVATTPGTYFVEILSEPGCIDTSRTVVITSVSSANPGTITGAATVCTGSNSTVLNVTGASGSLQWQRSANNSIFTDIPGATGTSYTASNLTVTTYYRVAARSGSCDPVYSASVAVTVGSGATSGVVSGATTVCSGTNSAVVTVTGNIGTIQWQSSTNNSTWTNITGATANSYTAINLTSTRYYRVVITNGTCGTATSSSVRILVNARSVAGTISGAGNVCAGINNQTLTLTGYTGSIQWQSSTDSLSFTNISGATSSTYTPLNLTATRYYRAIVTSGICPSAITAVATLRVSAGSVASGTIAGATTVCRGINSTTLVLSGNIGTIQWQSSTNNTTWSNISGASSNTYTVNNITGTRYYRVRVSSSCGSVSSASVTMRVNAVSVAGTISGSGSVCWGTNSRTLTLTGSTGSIQWQISTDNSVFTNISGATAATYTATNLTATRYYRAVVKSGVCNAVNSTAVAVVVDPISVAGTISGNLPVCAGTNSSLLTLSGYTGTIQWQSSTNNSTFTSIAGATSATYIATNLTTTTYFRAVVKSGSCVSVNSGAVMIQVNPITSAECTTGSSNNGGNGGNKQKQIAIEEIVEGKMRLYPNPSERSVFVDAGKLPEAYYLIRVLDLTGRELFRTTSGKRITVIDWGNLTAGTYMIEVREGVHSQILKAIKL